MNDKIYLEIFGYFGTALVVVSMIMPSVVKLRIFNVCGSVISMTYAILTSTWPIAVLNFALICINTFHLLRTKISKKSFNCLKLDNSDKCLNHFLTYYENDIKKFFPEFNKDNTQSGNFYAIFSGVEMVGVLYGERNESDFYIHLDYATPAYRDFSVGKFLYAFLANSGVKTLSINTGVKQHLTYLKKMGFKNENGKFIKKVN